MTMSPQWIPASAGMTRRWSRLSLRIGISDRRGNVEKMDSRSSNSAQGPSLCSGYTSEPDLQDGTSIPSNGLTWHKDRSILPGHICVLSGLALKACDLTVGLRVRSQLRPIAVKTRRNMRGCQADPSPGSGQAGRLTYANHLHQSAR